LGHRLPVCHIHEVTPDTLEPRLRYLAENGYRTVVADEIGHFLRTGRLPAPRSVALTFDDAWASMWTVAAPLLKRYALRAVALPWGVSGPLTRHALERAGFETAFAERIFHPKRIRTFFSTV